MRKDLNMRKGKMVAQGSHASMAFLTPSVESPPNSEDIKEWMENGLTKVCVGVDSEQELLEIYQRAQAAGLCVHLITDYGFTEFGGVPTRTCLAIGPNRNEDIDKITGYLKLL